MSVTPIPHGTHAGYARGCRCEPCTSAHALYMREYRAGNRPSAGQMMLLEESDANSGVRSVLRVADAGEKTLREVDRPSQPRVGLHHSNPADTELAAALSMVGVTGAQNVAYLTALVEAGSRGLTDHEAAMLLHVPLSSINGRRNDLGSTWVLASDKTRIGPYGKPNRVHLATARARRYVRRVSA